MHLEIGYFWIRLDEHVTGRSSNDTFFLCKVVFTAADPGKRLRTLVIWSLSPSRVAPHIVSFRLFSSCPSVLHVKPIIILHFVTSPLTSMRLSSLFEEPRSLTSSLASPPHDASACVYLVGTCLICPLSQFVACGYCSYHLRFCSVSGVHRHRALRMISCHSSRPSHPKARLPSVSV